MWFFGGFILSIINENAIKFNRSLCSVLVLTKNIEGCLDFLKIIACLLLNLASFLNGWSSLCLHEKKNINEQKNIDPHKILNFTNVDHYKSHNNPCKNINKKA